MHDAVELTPDPDAELSVVPDDDGTVVVTFPGGRLRRPAVATAALEVVARRERLTVGELVGLDRESRSVLARRLVREGVLTVAAGQ